MKFPSLYTERTPLLKASGWKMLKRLTEHPDAPRFNYATGDRLRREDLPLMRHYRAALRTRRGRRGPEPSEDILRWVEDLRESVPWFADNDARGGAWGGIPTSSRADLAVAPWKFVPYDQPLDRLVIYRTAGTTGHPISVPHHPVAIRFYEAMIETALAYHGIKLEAGPLDVAALLIGAQIRTYTYAAVLSNWKGAGFAKLNIRPTEWPSEKSAARYIAAMDPEIMTGDPISFSEMLRMGIKTTPRALITTSVALSPTLKKRLARAYHAPVIDWYSLVETGPIGYGCAKGRGYHVLPHDIHVEVVRADGTPAPPGELGEIAVTGGRNVFMRMLRYRTGDFGRMDFAPCACGDPMPRIYDLEGRPPILFRSGDGTPVSTVDISRLLREFPLLLHEFTQHADGTCELILRKVPNASVTKEEIRKAMMTLLGSAPMEIRFDAKLGDRTEGKAVPYRSEMVEE